MASKASRVGSGCPSCLKMSEEDRQSPPACDFYSWSWAAWPNVVTVDQDDFLGCLLGLSGTIKSLKEGSCNKELLTCIFSKRHPLKVTTTKTRMRSWK